MSAEVLRYTESEHSSVLEELKARDEKHELHLEESEQEDPLMHYSARYNEDISEWVGRRIENFTCFRERWRENFRRQCPLLS